MRPAFLAAALTAILVPGLRAQSTSYPGLVYASVQHGGTPLNLLLDLEVPVANGPLPVVAWIHGGGWQGGSRLPIPGQVTRMLARGYAVASIDYRLSGTAVWPAQIQDCKAAIRFLRANATTYGLDANRIAVMGSSAGGHLVAALATMGDVGVVRSGTFTVDLEGSVGPHLGTSSRVQAAVDLFGPTNMLFAQDLPTFDHNAVNSPESQLIGAALQQSPERWATVDPISFLTPDDAPLLAMHGTDDTTVPFHQSQLLVDAARAIGHDITFYQVQDNGHGGPGFGTPEASAAIDAFLDRRLRDVPDRVVGIVASDANASEGGDPGAFVISRSGATTSPLVVRLWPDGDVTAFTDCEPLPLLCTIPAGQSSTTVPFVPRDDLLVEGSEAAVLRIAADDRYRIASSAGSATIVLVDDDGTAGLPQVSLLPLDPIATEVAGNPGAVRVVRSGATTAALVVAYEIAGSAVNGLDYRPLTSSVTIAAGSGTAVIVVVPIQDQITESGELIALRLAASADYVRGTDRAAHVVLDDDDRAGPQPVVGVLGTAPSLAEPANHGVFTLLRTGATNAPLTLRFQIAGTASSGIDFAQMGTTAVIPVGAAWVRVPVTVLDDADIEGREDIVLRIVPDAAYRIGRAGSQQLWIVDDEAVSPAPTDVQLAIATLAPAMTVATTITGGAPHGAASLFFSLLPDHLSLPPLGIVGIDLTIGVEFVSGALDAAGSVTLPIVVPASPALTGLDMWWQAIATTTNAPFVALSPATSRAIRGTRAF